MESKREELDPEDWEYIKKIGHEIVNDMVDYLRDVRERPIWNQIPSDYGEMFDQPLPQGNGDFNQIYNEIKEKILKYPMGNIHPRFWGWVIGTGTIQGAFSDLIASTINSNNGGGNHSAVYVENQVINWSKEMLGFDKDASGLLTSGGSMANLVGLTVARHHESRHDIRKEGISNHKLRYYASTQVHSSNQKAIELLGIGYENFVMIPVDDEFKIRTDLLEDAIEKDINSGFTPICIIGNLGTVNTGAIDDLNTLADLAKKYSLWLHVDGAFGALTAITPNYIHLAQGMIRADSIAFDFHKWMYVNYEVGCILIKHQKSHYQSFALTPEYLEHSTRGLHGSNIWFSDYGVELSRGFKALKVWTAFKEHGIEKYGRVIEQNIVQAKYLSDLIDQSPQFERMAPTSMNIVCFRYRPEGINETDRLNAINKEIVLRLHENAVAIPSYTTLNGNYVIRVAITNHRSHLSDFDLLVNEIKELGPLVTKVI